MLCPRHNLAPTLSFVLVSLLAAACSSARADDDPASGDEHLPGDDPTSCGDIGEPCVRQGAECHFTSYDCDDIFHVCVDGAWGASQKSTAPACPEAAPPTGSYCDPFVAMCLGSCAYEAGAVQCIDGSWWAYPDAPATDCSTYADDASCASDPGCMWAVNCETAVAGCIPGVPCVAEDSTCGPGLVCTPLSIDPSDVAHGACSLQTRLGFCLPP